MESFIAGIVTSLIISLAKKWSHWNKIEDVAHAIVADQTNPINDPKAALEQAIIMLNQRQVETQVKTLGKRLELANVRAEQIRQAEAADPHDVEIIEKEHSPDEFKSPWSDGGGKGGAP